MYKKYVLNDNDSTVPLNGFTFVVLSLVHISGGKMTEGMAAFWFYFIVLCLQANHLRKERCQDSWQNNLVGKLLIYKPNSLMNVLLYIFGDLLA